MFSYKCKLASRIELIGIIVQILFSITGVILLFALFDDYGARWLIAILSCTMCCVFGYVNRLFCYGFAVITENQYRQILEGINESNTVKIGGVNSYNSQLPPL